MRESTDAHTQISQILDLFDKDLKTAIIKITQELITDSFETSEKVENLNKEIKVIKNKSNVLRENGGVISTKNTSLHLDNKYTEGRNLLK